MALINCQECAREVSDKAAACPSCGCPLRASPPVLRAADEPSSAYSLPEPPRAKPMFVIGAALFAATCLWEVVAFPFFDRVRDEPVTPDTHERLVLFLFAGPAFSVIASGCLVLIGLRRNVLRRHWLLEREARSREVAGQANSDERGTDAARALAPSPEPGAGSRSSSRSTPARRALVALGVVLVVLMVGAVAALGGRKSAVQAPACTQTSLNIQSQGFAVQAFGCSDGHSRRVLCDRTGGTMYNCSCALDDRILGQDISFDRSQWEYGPPSPHSSEQGRELETLLNMSNAIAGGAPWTIAGGLICSRFPEMQLPTE